MIEYNKLVRDNIPEIIEAQNKNCEIRILNDDEYYNALISKLKEEVNEFIIDPCIDELADISEVISALCKVLCISKDDLSLQLIKKRLVKGGFNKQIFLKWVSE